MAFDPKKKYCRMEIGYSNWMCIPVDKAGVLMELLMDGFVAETEYRDGAYRPKRVENVPKLSLTLVDNGEVIAAIAAQKLEV